MGYAAYADGVKRSRRWPARRDLHIDERRS